MSASPLVSPFGTNQPFFAQEWNFQPNTAYVATLQKCIVIFVKHVLMHDPLRLVGHFLASDGQVQSFWDVQQGLFPSLVIFPHPSEMVSKFEIHIPKGFENGILEFRIIRFNSETHAISHSQEGSQKLVLDHLQYDENRRAEVTIHTLFEAAPIIPSYLQEASSLTILGQRERALELIQQDPQLSGALLALENDPHILDTVHHWMEPLIDRLAELFREDPELHASFSELQQLLGSNTQIAQMAILLLSLPKHFC